MARSLIDIVALDLQLEVQLAKLASLKDFKLAVWRQEPEATGCSWNARIDWTRGRSSSDTGWWEVVPLVRERFNLR